MKQIYFYNKSIISKKHLNILIFLVYLFNLLTYLNMNKSKKWIFQNYIKNNNLIEFRITQLDLNYFLL